MGGSWLRTGGGDSAPGSSLFLSFALKLISYVSQVVLVNQTCSPGHYIVFLFSQLFYIAVGLLIQVITIFCYHY